MLFETHIWASPDARNIFHHSITTSLHLHEDNHIDTSAKSSTYLKLHRHFKFRVSQSPPRMTTQNIPHVAGRTSLYPEIKKFLHDNPDLHLGEEGDFHDERRHHLEVFGIHSLPQDKVNPIGKVEFTAIRGPHGTIPIRRLYPESSRSSGSDAALIYFHGGG